MPMAAVATAFEERLAQNWTATPILALNQNTEVPDGAAGFVMIQYLSSRSSKPVLQRRYFEIGQVRLVLKLPVSSGIAAGLSLCDQLAAIFRTRKFSRIETFEPTSPVLLDNNDSGNWFEFAVVVPYRYQFDSN